VSPTTIWPRRWQPAAGWSPAELSRLLTAPRSTYPAELVGGVAGVGRRHGQVGRAVRRTVRCQSLSTSGVHPVRFRSGVQPFGVQPSGVQPSGVQPSGVQPSGVQPSGVQPSGVRSPGCVVQDRPVRPSGAAVRRSAVWCPPVGPMASVPSRSQPAVALGSTPVPHGLRGWSGSGSGWPAGCPSGAVDGCGGLDAGYACGGRGSTAGSVPLAGSGPGPGCVWAAPGCVWAAAPAARSC
jgi:hypothetical protein